MQAPARAAMKPGAAFAEFAADILGLHYDDIRIEQTGGTDGAIDASRDTDKGRCVFEFKDIGQDGLEAARHRWKEVFKTLKNNLLANAPRLVQYQPWYEIGAARITHYVFCVSSNLPNRGRDDALRKIIEEDLKILARCSGLTHLTLIRVSVRDWLWFRRQLFRRAWLAYKWFPGLLPRGLLPVSNRIASSTVRFSDYLNSDRLPFYSLAEHVKADPSLGLASKIKDEAALLDRLLGPDAEGLFIAGPGGVGKTRLMLEIGRAAQARGWTVLQASDSTTGDQVDSLLLTSTAPQSLLLLIDYLETRSAFLSFASYLRNINAQNTAGGHQVRFIANCRSTFASNLSLEETDLLLDLNPTGDPAVQVWFEGYRQAATEHILRHSRIDPADAIYAECRSKPIFAVFARYLTDKGQIADLNALRQEQSFINWTVKRLSLTAPVIDHPIEAAGKLLSLYPLRDAHVLRLPLHLEALHNHLAQDQWLVCDADGEEAGQVWRAVHDILTDQFLTRAFELFAQRGATARESLRLLAEGARLDSVPSVLDALARIKDISAVVGSHSWFKTISEALSTAPEHWHPLAAKLLTSPLMSEVDKLSLLCSHPAPWADGGPEVALGLGKLLSSKKLIPGHQTDEKRQTLRQVVESLLHRNPQAEYLLSRALRWFPDDFNLRAAALALAPALARRWQGQYLLRAWLKCQADIPDVIAQATTKWLSDYCRFGNASNVLAAWLGNSIADPQTIASATLRWLDTHGTAVPAAYVLTAWLGNSRADPQAIAGITLRWLDMHGTSVSASHVIAAWLTNPRADLQAVAGAVARWLDIHGTSEPASHVLPAWLTNPRADPHAVASVVTRWLDANGASESASHLLPAWLTNPRADPQAVAGTVCRWLDANETSESMSHVLSAWLHNSDTDPRVVENATIRWLEANGTNESASHVLSAWLGNLKSNPLSVAGAVTCWLQIHGTSESATHVLCAWLGHPNADPMRVAPYLTGWLAQYARQSEADFCLRRSFERKAVSMDCLAPLAGDWLALWGRTEKASYVLAAWLRHPGAKEDQLLPHVVAWLEAFGDTTGVSHLLPAWLENSHRSLQPVARFLPRWLDRHSTDPDADFVLRAWLDHPQGDPNLVANAVCRWLDAHGTSESARFVLAAWFGNPNSDPRLLAHATSHWLNKHGKCLMASFVLSKYLANHKSDPKIVERATRVWLQRFGHTQQAQHVFTHAVRRFGIDSQLSEGILSWIKRFRITVDAGFVYLAWLRARGDFAAIEIPLRQWLTTHSKHRLAHQLGPLLDRPKDTPIRTRAHGS